VKLLAGAPASHHSPWGRWQELWWLWAALYPKSEARTGEITSAMAHGVPNYCSRVFCRLLCCGRDHLED